VSTVAVAGKRSHEVVTEDRSIDWDRSDYDPYARTKKFCEHMVRELLPDVPLTIFRPSIVLGDSRYPETTQFDMVRSFVFLAGLPVLPFRPHDKIDIVNVDFVADAIATLHMKKIRARHLSSFFGQRFADLSRIDSGAGGRAEQTRPGIFCRSRKAVRLGGQFAGEPQRPRRPRRRADESLPALFDLEHGFRQHARHNGMGRKPAPFSQYSFPLLRFSRECNFEYPYQGVAASTKAGGSAA
jgi:nucleoside-diphosphate-sugar epimerase